MAAVIDIGANIRHIRTILGLRQNKMIALLNTLEPLQIQFGPNDISKYETGAAMPPADKYQKILNLLPPIN